MVGENGSEFELRTRAIFIGSCRPKHVLYEHNVLPFSTVFLENLMVAQLVKKMQATCETRRFTAVPTKFRVSAGTRQHAQLFESLRATV
jgi:hypothetical protein